MAKQSYLCVTCGTQFAETDGPPPNCPICDDERQYVGWDGQRWTTLPEMLGHFKNVLREEEPGLHSIHTQPKIGIGQRALLVRTPQGNLLWDCVPLIDDATVTAIKALGGVAAIAVSHPHYYTAMIEWSHAFGHVPVHLHHADKQWVMRPEKSIEFWDGTTKKLFGGLTLINTGGHYEGFQVAHWPAGASNRGVLLSGDQPQVCQDRHWVSFMYSYPNMIPLPASAIRRIAEALKPFQFERLYGAFPGLTVKSDAKNAVDRSVQRYLRAIGS
ncbi:MAG: MBL fold metallo-hydrolase [Gemmataceae bacterium]